MVSPIKTISSPGGHAPSSHLRISSNQMSYSSKDKVGLGRSSISTSPVVYHQKLDSTPCSITSMANIDKPKNCFAYPEIVENYNKKLQNSTNDEKNN